MATADRYTPCRSLPVHHNRRHPALFLITLLWAGLLPALTRCQSVDVPTAIIVNAYNPVSNLTLAEAQALFRDERHHWAPGRPVTLVLPTQGNDERAVALRALYDMNELAFARYWTARIYRAQSASAPVQVESSSMVARVVATLPGGIGVVRSAAVPNGVKVVRIDGLLPGDPGYPLR